MAPLGFELVCDLCLADALVASGAARVVVLVHEQRRAAADARPARADARRRSANAASGTEKRATAASPGAPTSTSISATSPASAGQLCEIAAKRPRSSLRLVHPALHLVG